MYKHKREPLSKEEERRLLELEFFYFIKHMQEQLGHSAQLYNVLEALAMAAEIDSTVLKRQASDVIMGVALFRPKEYEYSILLWRNNNLSVRDLCKIAKVNGTKFYKALRFSLDNQLEYPPATPIDLSLKLECFMNLVFTIKGWQSEEKGKSVC